MKTYAIYFTDASIGHVLSMDDCRACDSIGAGFCECAADGVNTIHSLQNIGELRRALAFCADRFGLDSVEVATYRTEDDTEIEVSAKVFHTIGGSANGH